MRKVTLALVALGLLLFSGGQTAMAAYGHPGHVHRAPYRSYWAGYPYARGPYVPYTARYGAGCGVGGVATPYTAGYGGGYGYGYPQAGFGVGGRNFSLWFQQ